MSNESIFCARCGASGQKAEAYCRSCGEWLPDPTAVVRLGPGRLRGVSPERKQRRIHLLQFLSAMAAAAAGILTLAVHFGLHPDMLMVVALLCFVVVAWQVVAFVLGRSIEARRSQGAAEGGPALPTSPGAARPALGAADTSDLLRPPSVTENTTALLDQVPRKAGRDDRARLK